MKTTLADAENTGNARRASAPVDDPWVRCQGSNHNRPEDQAKEKTEMKEEHELVTTTQEQQIWHSDLTWLQHALDTFSFNATNLRDFQSQLRAIHTGVSALQESGFNLFNHVSMVFDLDEFGTTSTTTFTPSEAAPPF